MSVSSIGAQAGRILRTTPAGRAFNTYADSQRQIALTGVPNLTTPGDIRRAIAGKLQGVADVELDYFRFRPTGRAFITLTRHEFLRDNLRELGKLTLCGIPIKSAAVNSKDVDGRQRTRGSKGRAEAIARGAIQGTGPRGQFPNAERNVVMWGLPGRLESNELEAALHGFKLARSAKGQATIVKIPLPEDRFSMYSRFLVTMASVSEARRLVRNFHLTEWVNSGKQLIRAQVLH
ncbi:hypothetical protein D9615_001895 [Tricholomella constricta]|uniref:RRM domain-containing protein n=1 Tax=Tricholomella constricta TaxID=117010 RepID=A0A8H5MAI4_9AGAR|nr:hypothetical protein D9615_001895 [Tricholomella constricta]